MNCYQKECKEFSILSVTFDNGKEFAMHESIVSELDCDIYFAHPYRSWERGLHENTNGLIRQFFPKKTDFKEISGKEVARVEKLLNHRPRKTMEFKTPAEVFETAA